ncbi:FecR domain-containing protein [Marinobacter salinisoli]|uniref:FecR domain-containing protein n=1 Tax=Marinobacter salinisoli TaxID=2769486 RepID=A0ABX7MML2_9GAMM|nr:FecR domain-containing protein [Marinobacter salinisoli]QSP93456.1 FecR domain-containing protein [Marinobacter salinisoli]
MANNGVTQLLRTLGAPLLLMTALGAQAELSITHGSEPSRAGQPTATTSDWIYTLRSGDTFNQVASELLTANVSANRLRQYNNLADDTPLAEGDRLRIPLSWLKRQPEPARISSVSGMVQVISGADGRKQPVTRDTLIRVGDEILSGNGSATVRLADGSEIRISPDSRLTFNRLTQFGKSGMVDTRLRLNRGEIHTRVKPVMEGGARFEIETPSAVAAVRGTVFALQTSGEATSLQVTHGAVDFGKPGLTQRIPAGYGAAVSTGGTSGMSIRRLPPAPEIQPLPTKLTQLPTTLKWVDNQAPSYQLDIFDAENGRWVESRQVRENQHKLSLLDNGKYDVHVAAVGYDGVAGMPAVTRIDIDLQAQVANLVAPADGAAANDDMPEFQWSLNGKNELARVEIAEDESFNNLITTSEWAPENAALPSRPLGPGHYYWRVVTEAGGNSVAISKPRKLTVNGSLPPARIISVNYLDSQVRVFWERVATANQYLLQLSEEPDFDNVIKEATLADTSAALRLIPGRRYFVRLKALSEGPLTSRWGPGRELYLE